MVDHELDELRREFLAEARQKVVEIQSAFETAGDADLERVAYLAHQLKGSGGSYGYQGITTDAAAVEKALESLAGANPDSAAAVEVKIQKHIVSLRAEIDKRAQELG